MALSSQQGSGARRHRGTQPQLHALFEQREKIRPFQGIAAGEYHQRIAERTHFFKQSESLFGGQLEGIPALDRAGAAMHAGEVASLGEFPYDKEGCFVEVPHWLTCPHALRLRLGQINGSDGGHRGSRETTCARPRNVLLP